MTSEMTRSERQERREERRRQREAEREQQRKHTIKDVSVLDAYHSKPQYQGDYTEDGERPILNPPHAWFILVTRQDGTRWFLLEDAPFFTFWTSDMERDLAGGCKGDDGERQPLFQAGTSHVMKLEGLIAKARMEERAEAIRRTRSLDLSTGEWGQWPYSEYGSDAWAAEMQGVEMRERQDPRNW